MGWVAAPRKAASYDQSETQEGGGGAGIVQPSPGLQLKKLSLPAPTRAEIVSILRFSAALSITQTFNSAR